MVLLEPKVLPAGNKTKSFHSKKAIQLIEYSSKNNDILA